MIQDEPMTATAAEALYAMKPARSTPVIPILNEFDVQSFRPLPDSWTGCNSTPHPILSAGLSVQQLLSGGTHPEDLLGHQPESVDLDAVARSLQQRDLQNEFGIKLSVYCD
eukprot:TRINITY_DN7775_c0_g1_i2.p1 TRINITY_DN7775_c0_g1~~TRINITY_DN7775_c0_g1_i2.p1  ORF type:complete len:111 (+),score=12.74 TRINITY_DN7775_c0_g1_i2:65-397(+)